MFSILGAATGAAYHLVAGLAGLLTPLGGGLAAAAAIVVFTAAVRLLLLPLSYYALRGQAAQARLAPQVAGLRKRHAGQPERLQRELAALYRREAGGAAAGCLPLLLQLPVLAVLYRLFRSPVIGGTRNTLLAHALLGAPLGAHWLSAAGPLSGQGLIFAGLFALLAAVGWLASRLASTSAAAAPAEQAGMVSGIARVLPYSTVLVAAVLPLAAGLYLLTSSAWTVSERRLLLRRAAASGRPGPGPSRRRRADLPAVARAAAGRGRGGPA